MLNLTPMKIHHNITMFFFKEKLVSQSKASVYMLCMQWSKNGYNFEGEGEPGPLPHLWPFMITFMHASYLVKCPPFALFLLHYGKPHPFPT